MNENPRRGKAGPGIPASERAGGARFETLLEEEANRHGVLITREQVKALALHQRLLEKWSRSMNLTAIRNREEIIRRHFLEGILAGDLIRRYGGSGTLLDLGSGNGFPGVPIRVICPAASPLVLVESSRKRAAFLRALIRELGWSEARVDTRRVEDSNDLAEVPCDLFTTRGVRPFGLVGEGLPFLKPGGIALLFLRGEDLEREIGTLPRGLTVENESPLPGRKTGLLLLRKT